MDYTLEKLYALAGKEDKLVQLNFKGNSEAYNLYGSYITAEFIYTQKEREELDLLLQQKTFSNHGRIKVKYLGTEQPFEKIELLRNQGIKSTDIEHIFISTFPYRNTFHSEAKKVLKKIKIPTSNLPKGRDYDWIYGFLKQLVSDGVIQSNSDRTLYLAAKLFYEKESITESERSEIYNTEGEIKESVEFEYLQIKYRREEITDEEKKRFALLFWRKRRNCLIILDKYLVEAGSSLKKLTEKNLDKAAELFFKVLNFQDRVLNFEGKFPIIIDIDSYLHIYMRHVEEFKVNKHFEHKDNFLWNEEDVLSVIKKVVNEIVNEYQDFRTHKPTLRYSRYGEQSIYFQGDYYTLHIETNGRISSFHKNKKVHERNKKPNR